MGVDMEIDIEVERNGSELVDRLPADELGRGGRRSPRVEFEEESGKSFRVGDAIPSSVYNQSI